MTRHLSAAVSREDSRHYVNWNGQEWTTLEELRTEHSNVIKPVEPNLTIIGLTHCTN